MPVRGSDKDLIAQNARLGGKGGEGGEGDESEVSTARKGRASVILSP